MFVYNEDKCCCHGCFYRLENLLITAKVLIYLETEQIQWLKAKDKMMEESQELTGLGKASGNNYLMY